MAQNTVVLASGSAARRMMLENAGLSFTSQKPLADEDAIKEELLAEGAGGLELADALAEAKARSVSILHPEAFVIGSDQILQFNKRIYSKPKNRDDAFNALKAFQGEKHTLISAVVIQQAGQTLWRFADKAQMGVRPLSDDHINNYLDTVGDAAFMSVGSYQLEGLGFQLFDHIDGDYFTILGMPLLPLMKQLRLYGVDGLLG